jgi:riboflavin synthase
LGASIAVNGCCLTVTRRNGDELAFDAGEETLRRTNLGALLSGAPVNLERALQVGQRLGGHYVTGHIDGLGSIRSRVDDGNWSTVWFTAPATLTRQMASKGSVTVDGVSLTLVDVAEDAFSVALVPHTLAVTILGGKQVGDTVNLETDVLAKYIERQLLSLDRLPGKT